MDKLLVTCLGCVDCSSVCTLAFALCVCLDLLGDPLDGGFFALLGPDLGVLAPGLEDPSLHSGSV